MNASPEELKPYTQTEGEMGIGPDPMKQLVGGIVDKKKRNKL